MWSRHLVIVAICICLITVSSQRDKQIDIRGVYGHPQQLWNQGYSLPNLNVNAVFLHHKSITDSFMKRARTEKLKVYAEFATLNGEGYVEQHPEAWAIDNKGNKVEKATWFMGVCPTDSAFMKYRLNELKTLVNKYDLDGVWLDYLHWHAQFEDPEPILPETCFNNSCTNTFAQENNLQIPEGDYKKRADYILTHHESIWRQWRTRVIANWVQECRKVINKEKPGALLGIYHCPWNDTEFDRARIKILGLDYELLKKEADVFSPMVYHKRMGKDANWVKENIEWFSSKIDNESVRIWPIVQAHNDPSTITPQEFEAVLRGGVAGKATGVMMFTSNSVAEDSLKIATMKKVYGSFK